MIAMMKIALRNLYRQKRRTYLTVSIVAFGVVAVLLFTAVADSFKNMVIGQITDSARRMRRMNGRTTRSCTNSMGKLP